MPSHAGLLDEATKLHKATNDLKPKAQTAAADVASELNKGKVLEADAKKVKCPPRNKLSGIKSHQLLDRR